jgi:pyridoxal biosynthesis lyase PdxS
MSDPRLIKEIMAAVTIPVMAKARIGHFVEAQVRRTRADVCRAHTRL